MAPRCHSTITAGERRTQGAPIAVLLGRLRTRYRTGQRAVTAVVSLFSSLLAASRSPLLAFVSILADDGFAVVAQGPAEDSTFDR
jgi:hypothetical protein